MKSVLLLFASFLLFTSISFAQIGPIGAGGECSSITGSATIGQVPTATTTGNKPKCSWQAGGGAPGPTGPTGPAGSASGASISKSTAYTVDASACTTYQYFTFPNNSTITFGALPQTNCGFQVTNTGGSAQTVSTTGGVTVTNGAGAGITSIAAGASMWFFAAPDGTNWIGTPMVGATGASCTGTAQYQVLVTGANPFTGCAGAVGVVIANAGTSTEATTITSQAAGDIPLTIVGASGQTENLQNWKNSSGTTLVNIASTGVFTSTNSAEFTSANGPMSIVPNGFVVGFSTGTASYVSYFGADNGITASGAKINVPSAQAFALSVNGTDKVAMSANGDWLVGSLTDCASGNSLCVSGTITNSQSSLGSTPTDGLVLTNPTSAAAAAQQWSPCQELDGKGWATGSGGSSQTVGFQVCVQPIQGTTNPSGQLNWYSNINGSYTNVMSLCASLTYSCFSGSPASLSTASGLLFSSGGNIQVAAGYVFTTAFNGNTYIRAGGGIGTTVIIADSNGANVTVGQASTGTISLLATTVQAANLAPTNTGDVSLCWTTTGVFTKGSVCGTSLAEYKDNILPVTHGLDYVKLMNPATFDWKFDGHPDLGLIADQVAAIDPVFGAYDSAGKLYNFRDRPVLATAIKAIQELASRVDALEKK